MNFAFFGPAAARLRAEQAGIAVPPTLRPDSYIGADISLDPERANLTRAGRALKGRGSEDIATFGPNSFRVDDLYGFQTSPRGADHVTVHLKDPIFRPVDLCWPEDGCNSYTTMGPGEEFRIGKVPVHIAHWPQLMAGLEHASQTYGVQDPLGRLLATRVGEAAAVRRAIEARPQNPQDHATRSRRGSVLAQMGALGDRLSRRTPGRAQSNLRIVTARNGNHISANSTSPRH